MNKNYWENSLYPQFLMSIDSCTLSKLGNLEIQSQLENLARRAVTYFKFPKVSLDFAIDTETNPTTQIQYGAYFLSDKVGQKEYNVILARMKQYWIEFQISQERLFSNLYYDKDIRLHSPGNTLDKLIKMYSTFKEAADKEEYDYGRVGEERTPAIGAING